DAAFGQLYSEVGGLLDLRQHVRRAQYRLRRDARLREAAPADHVALDDGRRQPQPGGAQRRDVATWPTAHDQAVDPVARRHDAVHTAGVASVETTAPARSSSERLA